MEAVTQLGNGALTFFYEPTRKKVFIVIPVNHNGKKLNAGLYTTVADLDKAVSQIKKAIGGKRCKSKKPQPLTT